MRCRCDGGSELPALVRDVEGCIAGIVVNRQVGKPQWVASLRLLQSCRKRMLYAETIVTHRRVLGEVCMRPSLQFTSRCFALVAPQG